MKALDLNAPDHEEKIILKAGYEDVMHHFVGKEAFTCRADQPDRNNERLDKVVMQRAETTTKDSAWKCTSARIMGSESRQKY